jgi:hypothetical protein
MEKRLTCKEIEQEKRAEQEVDIRMELSERLKGVVVYSNTLKLDFDGKEKDYLKHIQCIKIVLNIIGCLKLVDVKIMQTNKGFHTYLYINTPKAKNNRPKIVLTPMAIVALQTLLGSDYKRESFNFLRVLSNVGILEENWNVLFGKKWNATLGVLSEETPRPDLKPLFYPKPLKKKVIPVPGPG